jgi:hypothetical protein
LQSSTLSFVPRSRSSIPPLVGKWVDLESLTLTLVLSAKTMASIVRGWQCVDQGSLPKLGFTFTVAIISIPKDVVRLIEIESTRNQNSYISTPFLSISRHLVSSDFR